MALTHNANYGETYLNAVALGGQGYLSTDQGIYKLNGQNASLLDPNSSEYKFQKLNPSEGASATSLQDYLDTYFPGGTLKEGLRPQTATEAAQSAADYERKKKFGLLEDQINPPAQQTWAQGKSEADLQAMRDSGALNPAGTKQDQMGGSASQMKKAKKNTQSSKSIDTPQISQADYQMKPGESVQAYNDRISMARGESSQPQNSLDVITDPVTGRSYSRDLSIPGSTYKPFSGTPVTTSASSIAPQNQTYSTQQDNAPTELEQLFADYGYSLSQGAQQKFKLAPAASWKEVYNSVTDSIGLADVKKQMDFFQKKIAFMDDELADKIADVNENPWLSEGVRTTEIRKLQDRYDLKKAPFAANLTTMQNLWNDGREEARYVATQALQQYNTERNFQLDQIQEMQDQAEKQFEAGLKLYELQNKSPDYGSGSIGEYQFAVSQGYEGSYTQYQNEDANRKISIARAGTGSGLTPYQENQTFVGITNKYQADPIINAGLKGQTAVSIADQIIANPNSATSQLKSLYVLVKNLDPESAVREGELALANQTQSYFQTFKNSLTRITEGRVIDPKAAVALAQATKELATAWNQTAAKRQQQYRAQAQVGNVGSQFNQYLGAFQSGFGDAGGGGNDPLGLRN